MIQILFYDFLILSYLVNYLQVMHIAVLLTWIAC
jgi:hypothetical protein